MLYIYLKIFTTSFPLIKVILGSLYAKSLNYLAWPTFALWFARLQTTQVPANLVLGLVMLVFALMLTRLITAILVKKTYESIFRNYQRN